MYQTQQLRQKLQQVQQICQQMDQEINQIDVSAQQQQRQQQFSGQMGSQIGSQMQMSPSQYQGGQYPQQMSTGSQLKSVPMGSTTSTGSQIGQQSGSISSQQYGMSGQGMSGQYGSYGQGQQMGSQMSPGFQQLGQTAPLSTMEPSHNSNRYGQNSMY